MKSLKQLEIFENNLKNLKFGDYNKNIDKIEIIDELKLNNNELSVQENIILKEESLDKDSTQELIIISENIPDLNNSLINNLIDNGLVKSPHEKNKVIELINDESDYTSDDEHNDELVEVIETNEKKIFLNNNKENINEKKILIENNNNCPNEKKFTLLNEETLKENNSIKEKQINIGNIQKKEKKENKINIVLENNNDSGSEKSLDYTNNDYLEINNNFNPTNKLEEIKKVKEEINVINNVELEQENTVEIEKNNNKNLNFLKIDYDINNTNELEKLTIKDLKQISKRFNVDTKKINNKGDKKINKTKKELCTEIISYLNI